MMKLEENNNRKIIYHLAKSSIKISKLRNFFTVFAIVLSVSLLMTMGIYTLGIETAMQRQVADMQQVRYEVIDKTEAKKMAKEDDVSYLLLVKQGMGIELGNKILLPSYYAQNPLKGKKGGVKVSGIEKGGKSPEQYDEAAVTREYCKLMEITPAVGESFSVTGVDGVQEDFIISGIINGNWESTNIYPILFSDRYAEEGYLLKDIPYSALVKLKDGEKMRQNAFEERMVKLGADYGVKRKDVNPNNYFTGTLKGDSMLRQQRMVMAVVGIGILFVSVLVIYSVFYLSVIGRIRQFGQLRTLGMTKKQTRKMVRQEGIYLSLIGIPIGLLIGGTVGYFLKPTGWDWIRTLAMAGIVIIADLITVRISLARPAALASGISPIEAAKYTGNVENGKVRSDKRQTKRTALNVNGYKQSAVRPRISRRLQRELSPFGLARISAGQNRKKTFLTMLSLGVGGILFMIAATFVVSVSLEEYSRQSTFAKGEYEITLSNNAAETSGHGLSGVQMDNPLNKDFINDILSINGVRKVYEYQTMEMKWEAKGEAEQDYVTKFDRDLFERIQKKYVKYNSEVRGLNYEDMVKNKEILILSNQTVEEVFGWKFKTGDKVKMTFDNGSQKIETEYTVAGFIEDDDYYSESVINGWFQIPQELLNEVSGELNLNDTIVVSTDESKEKTITQSIDALVQDNPNLILFTLNERREQDQSSFTILYTVILGLSIFIIGFSMLNLLNTLITNIVSKKQEYAMLESVGMSRWQLNRMVSAEGMILSVGNAIITLFAGTAAGYIAVMILRGLSAKYMHYQFPYWFYLGYIVVLIIIPLIVTWVTLNGFKRKALTERLREAD
jgi:putative ABC transport system permease protein